MTEGKEAKLKAFLLSFVITFCVMAALVVAAAYLVQGKYIKNPSSETEVYIPRKEDALSILVCGTGEDGKAEIFALIGFYPYEGTIPVAVLPPEALVQKRDMTDTLREVFGSGGASMAKLSIEQTMGVSIDRWIQMDKKSFIDMMNLLGPFDYKLTENINADGISFSEGLQQLDGAKAATLLLNKNEDDTPEKISGRRADIIEGLINDRLKATGADETIFKSIRNIIQTNISLTDFLERKNALQFLAKLSKNPAYTIETKGTMNKGGNTFALSKETVVKLAEVF